MSFKHNSIVYPSLWPPTASCTRAPSRRGSTPHRRHIEPSLHPLCSQIVHQPPCRKQNKCRFPHQPYWIRDCGHRSVEDEEDGEEKLLTHSLTQPDIEVGVGAICPLAMEKSRHRSGLLDVGGRGNQ